MSGVFCKEDFPFYLIKCRQHRSPYCFIVFFKKNDDWVNSSMRVPLRMQATPLLIYRHLYFIGTIFGLLFIMLPCGTDSELIV